MNVFEEEKKKRGQSPLYPLSQFSPQIITQTNLLTDSNLTNNNNMDRKVKKLELDDLINKVIELCTARRQFVDIGDYKKANLVVDETQQAYKKIIAIEGGIDELRGLIDHNEPFVRLWAASGLLPYEEQKAVGALEYLVHSDSLAGGFAEIVLDLWKKGELKY
jgi:hypothetical protein